jgi:hypothetical protein
MIEKLYDHFRNENNTLGGRLNGLFLAGQFFESTYFLQALKKVGRLKGDSITEQNYPTLHFPRGIGKQVELSFT